MVPTPRLAELIDLADRRGWRLALVGDPMQFSAVGRSGMFGHLVDTIGAIELDRVHRFDASWERDASLRLRRGDTDVVALYDHHDRLHGGTGRQMAKATVAAWRRATEAGETAAMMAPTRAGVDVLNELEREDRPRYQQALQVYEALEARHEAAKRAYLDAAKDTESLLSGDVPQGYGAAPVPPSPLRTLTMDVNSHKLVRIGAGNPRGVLCYLDEMNSWCGKLGDPRSGEDKSTWVAGFESRYYKLDRVGAGEIEAENYAVSIYGNIQPRVFANHVHKLSEDGLLQRFIPVKLRPEMTRLGQPHVGQFETKRAFDMMVRSVYGLPAMTYKLASDAEELFIGFQRWYHQRVKDETLLRAQDVYMQALGKIEGLMGRVILLFHMMTEPFAMNVSRETVEKVIQLTKGYIVPSMRFVYNGELTGSTSFDRWMMEHIIQYADATSLTLREIKAAASHQLTERSAQTKTDMVVAAMYTLEQAGWVVRKDDGSEQHRGIGEWFINPALREQFADHRKNVIVAKQRMLEYVNEGRFTKRDAHGYNQLTGTRG